MNCAKITLVGLAAAAALVTSVAFALAPPEECRTAVGTRSYQDAYTTQRRYLLALFESSYGCSRLEEFSRYIGTLSPGFTDPCRDAGARAARTDVIQEVTNRCLGSVSSPDDVRPASLALEGECARNGREAGAAAATAYCRGPVASGEFPRLRVCDVVAAHHCKITFRAYVNADEACRMRAMNDPRYENLVSAACEPAR
jgi:hypothetical protein